MKSDFSLWGEVGPDSWVMYQPSPSSPDIISVGLFSPLPSLGERKYEDIFWQWDSMEEELGMQSLARLA